MHQKTLLKSGDELLTKSGQEVVDSKSVYFNINIIEVGNTFVEVTDIKIGEVKPSEKNNGNTQAVTEWKPKRRNRKGKSRKLD